MLNIRAQKEDTWYSSAQRVDAEEKYQRSYEKAKREEELRRTEEFEQISKLKEEKFFRDVENKLDKGRDMAEEFSKNMKEKGFMGAAYSMFNSSKK